MCIRHEGDEVIHLLTTPFLSEGYMTCLLSSMPWWKYEILSRRGASIVNDGKEVEGTGLDVSGNWANVMIGPNASQRDWYLF